MENEYITALLAGLLGGVHCLGMCGGIVTSLTLSLPKQNTQKVSVDSLTGSSGANPSPPSIMDYVIFYNLGRITSYTFAGFLFGGFSMLASKLVDIHSIQLYLQVFAALLMLALGLYLGGWWAGLNKIEKLGNPIWKKIEPISRQFIPVTSKKNALLLGMLWGWLPCGLVYTILFMAIASASMLKGSLIMLSFAIGTLPMLLLMGLFATQLRSLVHTPWVRKSAGLMVIGFAFYNLFLVYRLA